MLSWRPPAPQTPAALHCCHPAPARHQQLFLLLLLLLLKAAALLGI
jgi:hypothetical protein